MKWLSVATILLAGCANVANGPSDLAGVQSICQGGARHVEVRTSGSVQRVLGVRAGRSGSHEGFILSTGTTGTFKVEDNVDLTGYIPLHRGDKVQLMGQYECNDGVIHWTHHDPSGRHPAGYIDVNGRTYR